MSSTFEMMQKKIASGEDLSSIVRTMKALAATSVRQYEKAAESLDDYYQTVEMGLSVVLLSHSEPLVSPSADASKPALMVIIGSDHGLAGRFNEQIVSYALRKLPSNRIVACIGEQAVTRVKAAGINVAQSFTLPTSISAITSFVQLLLTRIEKWQREEGVEQVVLFYNRPQPGGFYPNAENMLPVSLSALYKKKVAWKSRSLPTFTIPAGELLSALLRQYFFVSLYRACALSLTAENTSRLAAMQAAEKNINERLDKLKTAFQHERQAVITAELLDIISGFKAVRSKTAE